MPISFGFHISPPRHADRFLNSPPKVMLTVFFGIISHQWRCKGNGGRKRVIFSRYGLRSNVYYPGGI